jgi:hypothetical protein
MQSNKKLILYLWPLTALLILAFGVLVRGFAAHLPYHLDPDEPELLIGAHEILTTGRMTILPNYPPLYMYHLAVERWFFDLISGGEAGDTVHYFVARVTSVGYALLFAAAAFRAGKALRDAWTGFFFSAFFIFDASMIWLYSIGKADSFSAFLGMMCIWLGLEALRSKTHWGGLLSLSFGFGILATVAKYNFLPALIIPGLALTVKLWRYRWYKILFVTGVTGMVAGAVFLLANRDILPVVNWSYIRDDWASLPMASEMATYISRLFSPTRIGSLEIPLLLPLAVAGIILSYVDARRSGWKVQHTLLTIVLLLFALTFAMFSPTSLGAYRHVYMVYFPIGLCIGVALSYFRRIHWIIPLLLIYLLVQPMFQRSWSTASRRYAPDIRIEMGNWLVANVPRQLNVAIEYDIAPISPQFGGIPFEYEVRRKFTERSLLNHTIEEYRQEGIEFLVADSWAQDSLIEDDGMPDEFACNSAEDCAAKADLVDNSGLPQDFREETQLVFTNSIAGRRMSIYQILPPKRDINFDLPQVEHTVDIDFGGVVTLYGYDFRVQDNGLNLKLIWQGGATDDDFIYFVHVLNTETGERVAQLDTMPRNYGMSTSLMEPNEVVDDPITLDLSNAPDGCYQVVMGWYAPETFARLPAYDAQNQQLADDTFVFGQLIARDDGETKVTNQC